MYRSKLFFLKPIQVIIIIIFIVSGVLAFLLFKQKSARVEEQLGKKEFGWNPVAIKKMFVYAEGKDTLWLVKKDGVWKSNRHFDGMGIAPQLLIYLSNMQISQSMAELNPDSLFPQPIFVASFDKNGQLINNLKIGNRVNESQVYADVNTNKKTMLLYNHQNKKSLRDLLIEFISMD